MAFSPTPAFVQVNSASPTGRSSTTLVALGLAATLICQTTGRVLIIATGNVANGTSTDGASFRLYTGTSATPNNNDPVSGTALGGLQSIVSFVASELSTSFAISAVVSGLTVAGQYLGTGIAPAAASTNWFDIMFSNVTGGTVTFTNVNLIAYEF